jgi:hypothetical protein
VLESEQHQGDSESRERFLQKETLELRTQLALLLGEKQQLLENSKHSEQVANDTMLKLDEKEGTIRHLKEEVRFWNVPSWSGQIKSLHLFAA